MDVPFTYNDDQFWFSLSLCYGRKVYIHRNVYPYIWVRENGISNSAFKKDKLNYKIHKNLDTYYQHMSFLREILKIENYKDNTYEFGL